MANGDWRALLLCGMLACGAALAADADGTGKLEGEPCELPGGGAGVCRSIGACPEAKEALQQNEPFVICSYDALTPVVCCANVSAAARMCAKYGEAVFRYERIPTIIPQTAKIDQCALKPSLTPRRRKRVVGGEMAGVNEFPHMAALGYGEKDKRRWLCGGALISERYVLTAAQCLMASPREPVEWVRLGALNVTAGPEFAVAERIAHPEYKARVKYFDIALLRLHRAASFDAAVRPACLPAAGDAPPARAVVTGWGLTEDGGSLSEVLLKVSLPIVSNDACKEHFNTASHPGSRGSLPQGITENMLCAGGESGRDSCSGDSGGPLQVLRQEPYCTYSIVGIVSFGRRCGIEGVPGVYTRVSSFVPWIESVVWP